MGQRPKYIIAIQLVVSSCTTVILLPSMFYACELTFFLLDAGVVNSTRFGQGIGTIWLDDVQCSGTEGRLADCSHLPLGLHNCSHDQDAGVTCVPSMAP